MRRLLPLLTLLAFAAGCSGRERSNPLDPGNPQTGGRPEGFNAVAGFSSVLLSWTPRPDLAIDGFQLFRLSEGDSVYRALGSQLAPGSSSRFDLGVPNGRLQRYRLYYVIRGSLGTLPSEDQATPGPLRPWVADEGGDALVLMSPDGRDIVSRYSGSGSPNSIAVDATDGRVWTSDSFDGLVVSRDPTSPVITSITGVARPFTIAISPLDHSAWICDLSGSLKHYLPNGSAGSPASINLLDSPGGVAVNPTDYSVWVCEYNGNRVRHLSFNGTPIGTAFVTAPSRVTVDSLTKVAWVTSLDRGLIWRIAENGQVIDSTAAASGPIGIAIDRARGRAWIADAAAGRVLGLNLSTLVVEVTAGGLGEPRDVTVDRATGDVWVVARSERAVVRISSAGAVIARTGGFGNPFEVRLDPGDH